MLALHAGTPAGTAQSLFAGSVLATLALALCLYGVYVCRDTHSLSGRPMTQSMRWNYLVAALLSESFAASLMLHATQGGYSRLLQAEDLIQATPLVRLAVAVGICCLLAAIFVGIVGIGWMFTFPSKLARKSGTGYILLADVRHLRGTRERPVVVYPQPETRQLWHRQGWRYMNLP